MLATAVTSVSMEPPSLLVCVNRNASAYPIIRDRGAFSLGILGASEHELGQHLANAPAEARFHKGDWHDLPDVAGAIAGVPWLAEAQSTVFCRIDHCLDYGSHTVFIGLVEGVTAGGTYDPLLYCDGRYRRLGHALS
jgi:flavin reductase (DIM6/NTAB) family NADH-FMN oxidoreductase RutF